MTDNEAIDGDIAEFVHTQLALSVTFFISELRGYLIAEGHSPEAIHRALERWWGTYFVAAREGARLTKDGSEFVERLNRRR